MGAETTLKECVKLSSELPKELTSTATLITRLMPTNVTTCSYREHPPDYSSTSGINLNRAMSNCSSGKKKHNNSNYSDKKSIFPPNTLLNPSTLPLPSTSLPSLSQCVSSKQQLQQLTDDCCATKRIRNHRNTKISRPRLLGADVDFAQLRQLTASAPLSSSSATASVPSLCSARNKLSSVCTIPGGEAAFKSGRQHHRKNYNSKCENSIIAGAATTAPSSIAMMPPTMVLQQIMPSLCATVTALGSACTAAKSRFASASVTSSASASSKTKTHSAAAAAAASAATIKRTKFRLLPSLGATSFFTLLTLVCLETVLLSTVSNCAKTFYMHWNTSNSIFRIDNTDHIIDVNKGNLAFEFDQVHIICPVYEPGTFENETEKYIIYNVSKVEYETCRITNADPRVIAICDKPQKLMFFTITFRPFTPQPGGLEFLPGNDYYFISTSSKDDLYRRIGGRCSTNNMKVVFKVCCAPEEKNKTTSTSIGTSKGGVSNAPGDGMGSSVSGGDVINVDVGHTPTNVNQQHINNINTIGINGVNTAMPGGGGGGGININSAGGSGVQLKPMSGSSGTSINTNIDQFNRIPIQTNGINVIGNNIGGSGVGLGSHGNSGIMLTPGGGGIGHGGHGGINMIPTGGGGIISPYPGHHPGQTGIRINNVPSQQHHPSHKNNINNNNNDDHHYDKHPNEVVKNEELTYNSASTVHGYGRQLTNWKLLSVFCIPEYFESLFYSISKTTTSEKSVTTNSTTNLINLLATGISKDNIKGIYKFVFHKFRVNEQQRMKGEIGNMNKVIHKFMFSCNKILSEIMHIICNFNPIMLLSILFIIVMQFYLKNNFNETIGTKNITTAKTKTEAAKPRTEFVNSTQLPPVSANSLTARESVNVCVSVSVSLLESESVSESSLMPPKHSKSALKNLSNNMNVLR